MDSSVKIAKRMQLKDVLNANQFGIVQENAKLIIGNFTKRFAQSQFRKSKQKINQNRKNLLRLYKIKLRRKGKLIQMMWIENLKEKF